MIFTAIINLFLNLFKGFINLLPTINITIPSGICTTIANFFAGVTYFFPIRALLPILIFSISLVGFKIVYSLILKVKSFIPTMGGN